MLSENIIWSFSRHKRKSHEHCYYCCLYEYCAGCEHWYILVTSHIPCTQSSYFVQHEKFTQTLATGCISIYTVASSDLLSKNCARSTWWDVSSSKPLTKISNLNKWAWGTFNCFLVSKYTVVIWVDCQSKAISLFTLQKRFGLWSHTPGNRNFMQC